MSTQEFSHSESYKGYVNSILQSIKNRAIPDPVWGSKIQSNYEDLKQHCLQFIDKISTPPTIQVGSFIPTNDQFHSTFNYKVNADLYKLKLIQQVKIHFFRELIEYVRNTPEIKIKLINDQISTSLEQYQHEIEPFNSFENDELEKMNIFENYKSSVHNLFLHVLGQYIYFLPFLKTADNTTGFIQIYNSNHPDFQKKSVHFPPRNLVDNEFLESELNRLTDFFSISRSMSANELVNDVNKKFKEDIEKAVSWNVLCINEQTYDPAGSNVAFQLFAARAKVNLEPPLIDIFPSYRQIKFLKGYVGSYEIIFDEILSGEESFFHIAHTQIVTQKIVLPSSAPPKLNLITKLKFLRTALLRQIVLSTVNYMVSILKSLEFDIKEFSKETCFEDPKLFINIDTIGTSTSFPHCLIVRNSESQNNVIYEETHTLMISIRNDLLTYGSYYLRKWEKETSGQMDRKTIVEDLYECESKYQMAKRQLLGSLLKIYRETINRVEIQQLLEIIKFVILSRPLIAFDAYDYFKVP